MKSHTLACAIGLVGLLCLPAAPSAQPAKRGTAGEPGALPGMIPIFPLQDVMLFPNAFRPLLIFEPRYRAMIADALNGDRIIGMVMLRPGYEAEYEGRPPVYPIGCSGVVCDSAGQTLLPLHLSFCRTTLKNEASGNDASGRVFLALRIVTIDSRST